MYIRLDRNEMPRPPPKEIIEIVKLSLDKIHRYTPQYEVDILVSLLSDYTKAPQDSIILSSGSPSGTKFRWAKRILDSLW